MARGFYPIDGEDLEVCEVLGVVCDTESVAPYET